ncbi:MAG: 4Fe-4S dicluster domain-containing protein [Coriobacteriales bacterium]|jgi:formate dehydrogenase iron-sulfur subunit
MSELAIYFDSSLCTACRGCQASCKVWNELPSPIDFDAGKDTFAGTYQNPPDLNKDTRLIITFKERERENAYGIDWGFGRRACMHCTDAACVEVCPSGCLHHDTDGTGFVVYDVDKCIGCQYCRSACPFDVPRHRGVGVQGAGIKIDKCTACIDRVRHDRKPACVGACQPGALDFGDRDEMIAKAHERVDALKAKGFEDARVYGETEMGGLHVINVLKYDVSMYEPLPDKPAKSPLVDVLSKVAKPLGAVAAVGVVGGLALTYALAHGYHRDKLYYDEKNHDVIDTDTGEVVKHIDKEAGER